MITKETYSPAPLRPFPIVPATHNDAEKRPVHALKSYQPEQNGHPSWWVYPVDGSKEPALFVGSLEEMVAHINAEHLSSGIQYAGRRTDQ